MKSIGITAFVVLGAFACSKDKPLDTTMTTSAESPPPSSTQNTTPPPAVPDVTGAAKAGSANNANSANEAKNDGVPTAVAPDSPGSNAVALGNKDGGSSVEQLAPSHPAVANVTSTTVTTTTVTTGKVKPTAAPAGDKGYGPGAARNNGIGSTGPVGQGGGGIR